MGTELRRIWLVPILIANTEGLVCRVWDQNPKDTLVCGYVCKNPLLSTLRPPKCLCVKGLGPPNNQFFPNDLRCGFRKLKEQGVGNRCFGVRLVPKILLLLFLFFYARRRHQNQHGSN